MWVQIGLVCVLVLLNAAFAGTEMALVSLREGQLQQLEQRSSTGALVARLARDPNRFLATIQVGITLAGFLASAAAAVTLAEPLEDPLEFLGAAARPVSIVAVTLVLAYVTLVLGELAPKRVAMQRAERWSLLAARSPRCRASPDRSCGSCPTPPTPPYARPVATRRSGARRSQGRSCASWSARRARSPPSSA